MLTFMSFKQSVAMYHLFIDEYYDIIKNNRICGVQSFRLIQYMILYYLISYIYDGDIVLLTKEISDIR